MKIEKQNYRIFGRRKGRKLFSNLNILNLKKYLLKSDFNFSSKKIILDIGSGNGENAIYLSKKYPDKLIIASEVYQDGIINLSKQLYTEKIINVKIFNENILLLFDEFNLKNLISEIWILFPDPWPKKKHYKRRLINLFFIKKIGSLIEKKSKIFIATDSCLYLIIILKIFYSSSMFRWINNLPFQWDYSFNNFSMTKYYKKSLINKKKSFILIFEKI